MTSQLLHPPERIVGAILYIRGQKVMLDSDLAEVYGVKTFRLNEQVKRNFYRFPSDFMFQLTDIEKKELITSNRNFDKLKFSHTNPYAFTEHGAIMLASVLNTESAVQASVLIVRAFVKLREILSSNKELERKLRDLESKYDDQFSIIFKAIRDLMKKETKQKIKTSIGYKIPKSESTNKKES